MIWKNLVVATRLRRSLFLTCAFVFIYTGFAVALLHIVHSEAARPGGEMEPRNLMLFHLGIAQYLGALAFFLQRLLPFDFRRDGNHLRDFRALPLTPLGMAVAEVATPTFLCLALQTPGLIALIAYAQFSWTVLVLVGLSFPAFALSLNGVWNLYYLLIAARRTSNPQQTPSAAASVAVVVLSFLVFFPAGWCGLRLSREMPGALPIQLPWAAALVIQYLVILCLVYLLATLFKRVEPGYAGNA